MRRSKVKLDSILASHITFTLSMQIVDRLFRAPFNNSNFATHAASWLSVIPFISPVAVLGHRGQRKLFDMSAPIHHLIALSHLDIIGTFHPSRGQG